MFNLREFIKKGFIEAVGKMADYQIILNAVGWLEKGGLLSMPKCEKTALYSVVILDAPGHDRGDQVAPGGSDRDSSGGAPGEICSEGGVGGDSTSRFSDGLRDNSTSEDSKNAHRGTDFP